MVEAGVRWEDEPFTFFALDDDGAKAVARQIATLVIQKDASADIPSIGHLIDSEVSSRTTPGQLIDGFYLALLAPGGGPPDTAPPPAVLSPRAPSAAPRVEEPSTSFSFSAPEAEVVVVPAEPSEIGSAPFHMVQVFYATDRIPTGKGSSVNYGGRPDGERRTALRRMRSASRALINSANWNPPLS